MREVVPVKKAVLVRKVEDATKSSSSVIITPDDEAKTFKWVVVAAGEDCDCLWRKNDVVILYNDNIYKLNKKLGDNLYVTSEDNIIAYIKEDNNEQ